MKTTKFLLMSLTLMSLIFVLATCTTAPAEPTESNGIGAATTTSSSSEVAPQHGQTQTAAIPASPEDNLSNSDWQLVAFGAIEDATLVIPVGEITLRFGAEDRATGQGGCDSFGCTYAVQDGELMFGEIVRTLKACLDQNVTEQEQLYLQALRTAGRFTVAGETLTILFDDDRGVLNFVRASAAPLESSNGGTSDGNITRVSFGTGETSAEISATIAARATDSYALRAQQGQIMAVEVSSPNSDVLLSVVGGDGIPLKRYQNRPPSWTSQLPATQDYVLHAVSVGMATSYTLRVWIYPLSPQTGGRVEFEPGATSAIRCGALPEGRVKEYVLTAAAYQTIHIQTVGYSAPVSFTLHGPAGATWSGESQASEVYMFTAQAVLPQDGDYMVTLFVPPDAGATRYDVAFTIDSSPLPTIP